LVRIFVIHTADRGSIHTINLKISINLMPVLKRRFSKKKEKTKNRKSIRVVNFNMIGPLLTLTLHCCKVLGQKRLKMKILKKSAGQFTGVYSFNLK